MGSGTGASTSSFRTQNSNNSKWLDFSDSGYVNLTNLQFNQSEFKPNNTDYTFKLGNLVPMGTLGYRFRDVAGTVLMDILNTGKVGIGTADIASVLHLYEETSNTNTVSHLLTIDSMSSGTTAVGFGGGIQFRGERSGGTLQGMGRIQCVADVNTSSNLSSALTFHTATSGVNSEKVRISNDGNVGIGTTSPNGLLHLSHASFDYPLVIESSNVGWHSLLKTITNVTAVFGSARNGADGNFAANTAIAGTTSNHAFDIFTNNTKRLTISAAGASTFIGDLDVTSALTVGDFKLTSNVLSADTADGSDNKELYICAGGAQNANRGAYIDMTGNEYGGGTWGGMINLVAGEGGNADVKCTAGGVEVARFTDNATSDPQVQAANGKNTRPSFSFVSDIDTGMYRGGADILRFSTAGSARVTILANGNVGIDSHQPFKTVICQWNLCLYRDLVF